jgi:hypothetical protein
MGPLKINCEPCEAERNNQEKANPSSFLFGPSQKGTICSSDSLLEMEVMSWMPMLWNSFI